MKTRMTALPPSDKPGTFSVTLDGKGEHQFRLPVASVTQAIGDYWATRPTSDEAKVLEQAGITIGVCWRHETKELEAQYPRDNPTRAALVEFSEAVQRELEDEGYTVFDIRTLGMAITKRINERTQEAIEALKLADFTSPSQDKQSSP